MNRPAITKFKRRHNDEFNEFLKKLELQAIETAEERIPLYLRCGIKDAETILDVGCGSGIITRELALLTRGQVTGIDNSPDMIQVAKELLNNMYWGKLIRKDGVYFCKSFNQNFDAYREFSAIEIRSNYLALIQNIYWHSYSPK